MSYYKYLEIKATIDPELCYVEYLPITARLRYYKNLRRKNRKQNCYNRLFQERRKERPLLIYELLEKNF